MPVAMQFGAWRDGEVSWLGDPEDDGCNQERQYPGLPRRVMATMDFCDWMHNNPKVEGVLRQHLGWTWERGGQATVTRDLRVAIKALPLKGDVGCRDRVRWLNYWANRVREVYGDEAVLAVSCG